MSQPSADRPDVIVFPPLILLAVLALALLQRFVPLGLLARVDPAWRIAVGGSLFAAGFAITAAGSRALIGFTSANRRHSFLRVIDARHRSSRDHDRI